jgi:hypothetical protein
MISSAFALLGGPAVNNILLLEDLPEIRSWLKVAGQRRVPGFRRSTKPRACTALGLVAR